MHQNNRLRPLNGDSQTERRSHIFRLNHAAQISISQAEELYPTLMKATDLNRTTPTVGYLVQNALESESIIYIRRSSMRDPEKSKASLLGVFQDEIKAVGGIKNIGVGYVLIISTGDSYGILQSPHPPG